MQKVLRINLHARNQGLQKTRRKTLKETKKAWAEFQTTRITIDRKNRDLVKTERRNRREDWIAGPLAPKRDVGTREGLYGTLDPTTARGPEYPAQVSKWPQHEGWTLESKWEGYGNEGNIMEGDRVCVVHGHDSIRGKIGEVKEVHRERREVTIADVNIADLEVPEHAAQQRALKRFSSTELPVPIDNVRLVVRQTLIDEKTGRTKVDRDVLVNLLRGGAPYHEQPYLSPVPSHTRYIAGEDTEIAWPAVGPPHMEAFDRDTTRYNVERKTYTPSLYHAPLPRKSILDELRPKHSIDRTSHEHDYVLGKILEDARAQWYADRGLDTPGMEIDKLKQEAGERRTAKRMESIERRIAVQMEEDALQLELEAAEAKKYVVQLETFITEVQADPAKAIEVGLLPTPELPTITIETANNELPLAIGKAKRTATRARNARVQADKAWKPLIARNAIEAERMREEVQKAAQPQNVDSLVEEEVDEVEDLDGEYEDQLEREILEHEAPKEFEESQVRVRR